MPACSPGSPSWLLFVSLLSATLASAENSTLGRSEREAQQGSTCPSTLFATRITPGSTQLQAELAKLGTLTELCDMRADYQAHRGALLLMAGQVKEAATALEKALLLNPELPGAQLDYAQALAQQGDPKGAQELLRQVASRPDIQPDLLQWIDKGLNAYKSFTDDKVVDAQLNLAPKDPWRWSGLVQSSLGKETNLFSATHTTSLTLHLTSGLVEVPLSDSERPVAGGVLKLIAATQGVRALGDGEVRLNLAVQTRRAESHSANNSRLTEGALAYATPVGPGKLLGGVSAHTFTQGGIKTYLDHTYTLQYEPIWRWGDCKSALSLGNTAQRYTKSPEMDGRYQHVRLEGGCQPVQGSIAESPFATVWSLATGEDKALNVNRPGGNKQRIEALIRHERSTYLPWLEKQGALSVWYRHNRSRDTQIFSSLLGSEPTQTQRHDAGVGYWYPLSSGWSLGLDVESTSQKSTNTLLNIKNISVYGGLRWASN